MLSDMDSKSESKIKADTQRDASGDPGEGIPSDPSSDQSVSIFGNLDDDESYEGIETETGEINWDCPCLGKITQPPCGDVFKEAFSCFFYSKSEPKGSECIDLFRKLRDCFDKYPEIYSDDSGDEDTLVDDESAAAQSQTQEPGQKPPAHQNSTDPA